MHHQQAIDSQIKEMMDFGNTLVKWKYEIVNSFVPANGRRISNGLIENRNKSIKLLKHSSNGYLNWHRFKTRIMYSLNKDSTYHLYPIKNKGGFYRMMTRKKIYTLIVDNHDVSIISRQRLLEDILYRLNMIYEYADELDDLTQEINMKLDKLIEKAEKKNHDPSSDHDSPIQF